MGGKNPMLVLDDADLDVAVDCAINSGFYSTGQRCTASSKLIVTQGIYDKFCDALTAKARLLKVGDARSTDTQVGPVVDQTQLEQDLEYVRIGQDEGANLLCGGEHLRTNADGAPGFYFQPAVFVDTSPNMRINREEIFGPVVSVLKARDYEEALMLANDSEFGLAAGIATTSLK